MAKNFTDIDIWKNEGVKPDDALKKEGFKAGYKPPASIFNWFWHKVTTAINELQNGKANAEHIHTPGDIVYTPRAELKCVFAIIDETENKDHFAGWEVVDPKSLPVEILQGARKYNAKFSIGSSICTDIIVFNENAEIVDMKNEGQPQWGEVTEDTPHITFYTYAGYVRYIGEKHGYSNAERFNVNDMGNIDFIFPPGHTHDNATDKAAGFMSAADKEKLDNIPTETVGSVYKPIYWANGKPKELGSTGGNQNTPICMINGEFHVCRSFIPVYDEINDDTDWDNLTSPTGSALYPIATSAGTHKPYEGSTRGLLYSDGQMSSRVQIFIPSDYLSKQKDVIYIRCKTNTESWGEWSYLGAEVFAEKKHTHSEYLPMFSYKSSLNFNQYTTTGVYFINEKGITNGPNQNTGILIVDFDSVYTKFQMYIQPVGGIHYRTYSTGNVWTAWEDINADLKNSIKNRTHIVIATYDTKNPLKNNADYVCTSENASTVIRQALAAVQPGGKIELLDGTYNLQYEDFGEGIVINKSVCIEGAGKWSVGISQPTNEEVSEANPIFTINAKDVTIKNLCLSGVANTCTSPVSLIKQKSAGVFYYDLFLWIAASDPTAKYSCIEGVSGTDCRFSRIQDCRLYRAFRPPSTDFLAFDFRECANFSGVIGGNMSSGYGNIDVGFATESHRQATAIYGHTAISLYIENTKKKETIDYKGDITTTDY